MDEIYELKLQKQCALKEINEVLSRIIVNLKELNEVVLPDGTFIKSLEDANRHLETLKQQVYLMESDEPDNKSKKTTKKRTSKPEDASNSVRFINVTINDESNIQ